jgi:hypothetical protein
LLLFAMELLGVLVLERRRLGLAKSWKIEDLVKS